jgi:hypothetical protein
MDYFSQQTERLQFRALSENDIESWLEFFQENPGNFAIKKKRKK